MNSHKDAAAVATDATYVIVGASGNTGSIIANSLLAEGRKVRAVGAMRGGCSALCAKARKRSRQP